MATTGADPATLDRLGAGRRPDLQRRGELTDAGNFNGSARSIAGILNETRTVLGMMPHPENVTDLLLGGTDGQGLFDGIVRALQ